MRHAALILALVVGAGTVGAAASSAADRPLPPPDLEAGVPLMEALALRRSMRAFDERPLDEATLGNLLWAAFGINRPETDDHTAPSWRSAKETDIHALTADGVWRYDPRAHALVHHMDGDLRALAGRQAFVGTAPVVLAHVADLDRMPEADPDDRRLYAHVDAAFVSQNVYLFAASEGLATVVLGNVDRAALSLALGLGEGQLLTFTQPIGHPAP